MAVVGVEPLEEIDLEGALGEGVGGEDGHARPRVGQVAAPEPGFGPDSRRLDDRSRVLLHPQHGPLDVRPVEGGQHLLQVAGDAAVVHHQAVRLLGGHPVAHMGEPAVHPGDGLEQPVLPQPPVEVEHLLHRGVEAGEQHVHHHQHLGVALGIDEGLGDQALVQLPGRVELDPVLGAGGDDRGGAHPEVDQVPGVAHRRGPAGGHHLGLEPVGPHLGLEVLGDVEGDHLDPALGLGHGLLVGVAAPQLGPRLLGLVAEQGVE